MVFSVQGNMETGSWQEEMRSLGKKIRLSKARSVTPHPSNFI